LATEVSDNVNSSSFVFLGMKSMILILTKSFLDEWKGLVSVIEPNDKEIIIECRRKAKPFIDRINEWKDINEFRNSVLAHNFRKGKEFNHENVFIGNHINSLVVPEDITELVLLSYLIIDATSIVTKPFSEQLDKTVEQLYKSESNRIPKKIDPIQEIERIRKKIKP